MMRVTWFLYFRALLCCIGSVSVYVSGHCIVGLMDNVLSGGCLCFVGVV